jgi:UDP-N-acetylmuramate--alanine ligase
MLGKEKYIYFVGIGGIGMSGIAEVLINLGFRVGGSDIKKTAITERLEKLGSSVKYQHRPENIKDADIVVVSSAIGAGNPEVEAAKENGIPVIPRTEMLGELMRIRTGIAVAGAHGKTTTTSLAAAVLDEAGFDPTAIVGGKVKSLRTNARLGKGKFMVAEADESDGNFIHLSPVYAIITSIDIEHTDFYGGLEGINDAFATFANRVPFHGAVICCGDDPNVQALLPRIERKTLTYGLSEDCQVWGKIMEMSWKGSSFSMLVGKEKKGELFLSLPGRHNVRNALAVCALALELGIDFDSLKAALSKFEGVRRRFEIMGEEGGVMVMDDYAHHPTEVKATVSTVRKVSKRRIVVVFQPHRFTRTRDIHQLFKNSFDEADEVFITEVYGAGERPIPGISGELVYRAVLRGRVGEVNYVPQWKDLIKAVRKGVGPGDLVFTLGAGNIRELGTELLGQLKKRKNK